MKRIFKDYFTFSKKERTAVIILLLLIIFFAAAPYFYSPKFKPPVISKAMNEFLERNKTAATAKDTVSENERPSYAQKEKIVSKHETFAFDPNTISENDWKRLGISDKTIHTIINYRSKGGKFRSAEDIRKIWGFKKEDAERLIPFVRIENTNSANKKYIAGNQQPINVNKVVPIDINTASFEEWRTLPGISEGLANRIVMYRERIGGFISKEQVHKTYGVSDSVFGLIAPFLIVNMNSIPKLNINIASAYELRTKINIPDAVARSIIIYRQQYGNYQVVSDLKKIVFISDSLYQRIAPYLKTE